MGNALGPRFSVGCVYTPLESVNLCDVQVLSVLILSVMLNCHKRHQKARLYHGDYIPA